MTDLLTERKRIRAIWQTVVVVLSVAFYLAVIPVVVLLSGPIYRALECTLGECSDPGTQVEFILPSRGALRIGSTIRLPNGEPVGEVVGFRATGDERFTSVVGRIDPDDESVLERPLRCEATANFNIEMDADLVVSHCPDLSLPTQPAGNDYYVCGTVDHFERMGQELRRFVLENVRPGEYPTTARLSGPCGSDNEAMTAQLRSLLSGSR